MASYSVLAAGHDLFELMTGTPLAETLVAYSEDKCTLRNWDGSYTQLLGSGLVWDDASSKFVAGTVAALTHFSQGAILDSVTGLALTATDIQQAMEDPGDSAEALRELVFAGDDTIDLSQRLAGPVTASFVVGYGGNDLIYGDSGPDEIWGESGADTIAGNDGNDFINGGLDDDQLYGGNGMDRLVGDGGADTLSGGAGHDVLYGGAGNDVYRGGSGTDTVVYTRSLYDLIITKTDTGFKIIEPNGQDTLLETEYLATDEGVFAWDADEGHFAQVSSRPGALLLDPDNGVYGTNGRDIMRLKYGQTIAFGYGGNDAMVGTGAYDLLLGGNGNDRLFGDATGSQGGGDRLYGQNGNDILNGNDGGDMLYGGAGHDRLVGGNGNDTMTGGANRDIFIFRDGQFNEIPQEWGDDVIKDFQLGYDKLEFDFSSPGHDDPSLIHTSSGWLVSLAGSGSVLLQGLHTPNLSFDDIML